MSAFLRRFRFFQAMLGAAAEPVTEPEPTAALYGSGVYGTHTYA